MAAPKHTASPWVKTPTPNLIRYTPAGTYYLRARFGGAPVRESLETTDYQTARLKLAVRLEDLRAMAGRKGGGRVPVTLADALALVKEQVESDPSLKTKTRASYLEQLLTLSPSRKASVPTAPLRALTGSELAAWWTGTAVADAPGRGKGCLRGGRRAGALARKRGALHRDPTEGLKRVKVPRTRLTLLTGEQFRAVLASIRQQRKANSEEAANWIEFMAYCGLRPTEVAALTWEDLDEKAGVIAVHGGAEGTKNRRSRRVPMAPAMVRLVKRMRGKGQSGSVFTLKKPHDALTNACARLGFPHQRIYDLRHAFATACAKSGVDVPTFAKWLGHQDGGKLAMSTYTHPDEEHGLAAVKKVKF